MEALLPFLAIGFVIWVVLAATRRSPNTSAAPRPAATRPPAQEEPVVTVKKPTPRPRVTVSTFGSPEASVGQQKAEVHVQSPSAPQKHLSLFQGRDEIVKAVIYHEIFTPKFKR